jgi:hypothetical protein
MLDRVEALMLINGAGGYEEFVADLNAISERYKTLLAQHHGRSKHAKG